MSYMQICKHPKSSDHINNGRVCNKFLLQRVLLRFELIRRVDYFGWIEIARQTLQSADPSTKARR